MKKVAKLVTLVLAVALLIPGLTYATTSGSSDLTAMGSDVVVGQINYMVEEVAGGNYSYSYTLELFDNAGFIAHGVDVVVFGYVDGSVFGFVDSSESHLVPPPMGSPFDPYLHIVFAGVVNEDLAGDTSQVFGFISTNSPSSGNIAVFDGQGDAEGITTTGAGGTTGGGGTVPEPGTLLMLASGLLALAGVTRLKDKR